MGNPSNYPPVWRKIREKFLKSHKYCEVCGRPADTVDHIIPASLLPADLAHSESNLRALCRSCNSRKGSAHDRKLIHMVHGLRGVGKGG